MPFSFIHTADIHVGHFKYGKINPKTGIDTSIESTLNCLDEAINFAIDKKVDAFLVCGDLSKERHLSELVRSEIYARFKKLANNNIEVIINIGNHDESIAKGTAFNIKSLMSLDIKNVNVADIPKIVNLKKFNIIAMPFINDVNVWKPEYEKLRKKLFKTDKPLIVALHGNVEGVVHRGSELLENDEPIDIPLEMFKDDPNLIYVACGHQHEYQILMEKPCVLYSGSLDRVSFSEKDQDKGFVYVKYNDGVLHKKFIKVNARKFVEINIENGIPNLDYKNAIVKVKSNIELDSFKKEKIYQKLKEMGSKDISISIYIENSKKEGTFNGKNKKTRIRDWISNNVNHKYQELVKLNAFRILQLVNEKMEH